MGYNLYISIFCVVISLLINTSNGNEFLFKATGSFDRLNEFCTLANRVGNCYVFYDFAILTVNETNIKFLETVARTTSVKLSNKEPNLSIQITEQEDPLSNVCYEQNLNETGLWGLKRINQRPTLSRNTEYSLYYNDYDNGENVSIYILDTGIHLNHLDFSGRARHGHIVASNPDFGYTGDLNGHGTSVAGLAASDTYGVAKESSIISVKIFGRTGGGSLSDVIDGLNFVLQEECEQKAFPSAVINLSFSSSGSSNNLFDAIVALYDCGVTVVTAAGNDFDGSCYYIPAKYDQVINVGSIGMDDYFSEFSNWGSCVDICAPGEDLLSTAKDNNFATRLVTGTSFSAPIVAGIVARIKSYYKTLNNEQIKDLLRSNSTKDYIKFDFSYQDSTPNQIAYMNCAPPMEIPTTTTSTATTPEPSTTTPCSTTLPPPGLSTGAIVGICVAVTVVLFGIGGLLFVKCKSGNKICPV